MLIPTDNGKLSLEFVRAWEPCTRAQMLSSCVGLSPHLSRSLTSSPYFKGLSKLVKLTEQISQERCSPYHIGTDGRNFRVA